MLCPANDMNCPYWAWGGRCTLENAEMECDEFFGLEDDEEEEETDEDE